MSESLQDQNATASLIATFQSRMLKTPKDKRSTSWIKTNLESLGATMAVPQRRNLIASHGLCENCIKPKHVASECRAPGRCFSCGQKHHTSLHAESHNAASMAASSKGDGSSQNMKAPDSGPPKNTLSSCHCASVLHSRTTCQQVILATALIELQNDKGETTMARALLDQGSEFSFITEEIAQCLSLKKTDVNVSVLGIGSATAGSSKALVTARLKSSYRPELDVVIEALVIRKLTDQIPAERIRRASWPHLFGLQLADPSFDQPGKVDCIIGAELYGQLLTGRMRRGARGDPIAQETAFGWILSGPTDSNTATYFQQQTIRTHHVAARMELREALQAFWKVEEPPSRPFKSPEDELCEQIFSSTVSRNDEGRFMVRLPLKTSDPDFGDTRIIAVARWLHTESRLKRHALQAAMHHDFLRAYRTLGHMEPVSEEELPTSRNYYMPHHCIIKRVEESDEFKVRVVFNASQASTNGKSLNNELLSGPKLQGDLWIVLTLWRLFKVAFTADIVKMFRHILVDPRDAYLQLIIWREKPEEILQTYRLLTVTYGTSAAPFLANRTLIELAQQHEQQYPIGARIVRRNKYVDDYFAGGDSPNEATEAKKQIAGLLAEGGFPLSKWATNCPELLGDNSTTATGEEKKFKTEGCVWALGTAWLPSQDCFTIKVATIEPNKQWTKRGALSKIAKLFDPLGWLGPVVIRTKALMQDLWLSGIKWDDPLPPNLLARLEQFMEQLPELTTKKIPSWFGSLTSSKLQLHGFSDASERAYAACIYLVAINGNQRTASLVLAKTKVAPIRTLSIPRLELCGAHLAAQIAREVNLELGREQSNSSAGPTPRSGDISTLLPTTKWQHVSSKENPADLASRGASPAELRDSRLWWTGPSWLEDGNFPTESLEVLPDDVPERRAAKKTTLVSQIINEEYLLRFSAYSRLLRVTAYCLRFLNYCKVRRRQQEPRIHLSSRELIKSRNALIKQVQEAFFSAEVKALKDGLSIPKTSSPLPLRPFIDDDGLLRFAGRLTHSALPYAEKHPIILLLLYQGLGLHKTTHQLRTSTDSAWRQAINP